MAAFSSTRRGRGGEWDTRHNGGWDVENSTSSPTPVASRALRSPALCPSPRLTAPFPLVPADTRAGRSARREGDARGAAGHGDARRRDGAPAERHRHGKRRHGRRRRPPGRDSDSAAPAAANNPSAPSHPHPPQPCLVDEKAATPPTPTYSIPQDRYCHNSLRL